MLYKRQDGTFTTNAKNHGGAATRAVNHIQDGITGLEKWYDHLNAKDHARLRALAGRLIAMVEDE